LPRLLQVGLDETGPGLGPEVLSYAAEHGWTVRMDGMVSSARLGPPVYVLTATRADTCLTSTWFSRGQKHAEVALLAQMRLADTTTDT
jgi:hypothetical protein